MSRSTRLASRDVTREVRDLRIARACLKLPIAENCRNLSIASIKHSFREYSVSSFINNITSFGVNQITGWVNGSTILVLEAGLALFFTMVKDRDARGVTIEFSSDFFRVKLGERENLREITIITK